MYATTPTFLRTNAIAEAVSGHADSKLNASFCFNSIQLFSLPPWTSHCAIVDVLKMVRVTTLSCLKSAVDAVRHVCVSMSFVLRHDGSTAPVSS